MNRRRMFGVLALVVVVLLVSAPSALARATKTPFTGTCVWVDEPESPDLRMWYSGARAHMRDAIEVYTCDFSDDRLDGLLTMVINWNVEPFDWYYLGHEDGSLTIADADGNVSWEGGHVSDIYEPWTVTGRAWLHGRGVNEGLKVESYLYCDSTACPGWAGEILDPGQ